MMSQAASPQAAICFQDNPLIRHPCT